MLMSPNKDETAVHGCHCSGDMVMRMRKILAIPRWFVVCAPYFYFSKTIPLEVAHTYLAYRRNYPLPDYPNRIPRWLLCNQSKASSKLKWSLISKSDWRYFFPQRKEIRCGLPLFAARLPKFTFSRDIIIHTW